ncbi:uncharacterized protein LOC124915105 [Impatiens glandulifera]|uniref:uncharacterized protein LOC124915105 n=1 Tax=Impatiens glandulifera TaxID=253017 RepID=UPI001FB07B7F|nr:uncharacterized protein LOC124915105 [Impatiens glandulifera]
MADQLELVILSSSIILFSLIAPSSVSASSFPESKCSHSSCQNGTLDLISEIQEAKLRIARLESILDGTIRDINAKTSLLKQTDKRLDEMSSEISRLQTIASKLKGESLQADEHVKQLEEEVRVLWATLRRSNFEVYVLESKVKDNKENLNMVASQVQKMADIVSEQWIQIQQLQQALVIVKTRTLHVKEGGGGLFSRFTSLMSGRDKEESYISSTLLAFKKYHLQLQHLIKKEMEKNKYLAILAHNEVVFLLASALITLPAVGAWIILFSRLSSEEEEEEATH